jgi:soluble cytochrome b562
MLGATQKQLFNMDGNEITGFKPYTPYSTNVNDYVAGFSPLQQQAQQATGQLGVPSQYGQATQMTGMAGLGSLGLAGQMAGAGQDYAQQATNPMATQAYMSPYMQNVVDYQKSQALRDYGIGQGLRKAQSVGQGAFGGNRQALVESEAQRALGSQIGGIEAQGAQQAFQNAQQAQQYAANLGMQGRQGALQGLGQYGAMGNQLGQLGGQELAARQGIINAQYGMGQQQQAMEQQKINQAMQDWANTQQYPLMQLGVMSNMLRGLPMQASTTNQYQAAPNALTQGIGAAGAGASLYNALRGRKGGLPKEFESSNGIKSYYEGEVVESTKSDLYDLPLDELQKQAKSSPSNTVKRLANSIIRERTGKAGGGIIAFAEPNETNNQSLVKEEKEILRDEKKAPVNPASIIAAAPPPVVERAPAPVTPATAPVGSSSTEYAKYISDVMSSDIPVDRKQRIAPLVGAELQKIVSSEQPPVNPASIVAAKPAAAPPVAPTTAPTAQGKPIFGGLTEADIAAQFKKDQAAADRPLMDIYKEKEAAYKEAGIDNKVQENRKAEVMAERASSKDEAKRQFDMRLAAFFADWGTKPGNTLVAGMDSLKKAVPDFIADKQEQRKYLKEINKTIYDLDNAVRLEKKGNMDEAEKIKQKAAEKMQKWYPDLLKYQSDRLSDEAKIKAAGVTAGKDTYSDKTYKDVFNDLVQNKGMDPKDPATATLARKETAGIMGLTQEKLDIQREAAVIKGEKDSETLKALKMDRYGTDEGSKERADIDAKISAEKKKIRDNVFKTPAADEKPVVTPTPVPVAPAAPKVSLGPAPTIPKAPDISTVAGAPAGSGTGAYVQGKGYEVRDKNGKLLGYAQ